MPADLNPFESSSQSSDGKLGVAGRLAPGRWTWLGVILLVGLSIVSLATATLWDRAVAHIAFVLCNVIALTWLGVWFSFRSAYPWWARTLAPLSLLGVLVLLVYLFPVDSLSGTLRPTFRWRFAKPPDHQLAGETASGGTPRGIDVVTTTDADFPQFLGPNRNAVVVDADLARDWTSDPPREVWRHKIGAGWSAFSAVNGYAVTMEQRGPWEMVTCYEIRTGDLVWSHSFEARHETVFGGVGPRSTPTIFGGKVYALGATGHLVCLEGADGSLVWQKSILDEVGTSVSQDEAGVAWGRANSPLVFENSVVVPGGGVAAKGFVSLLAYERETGRKLWAGGDSQISYSSPTLATLGDRMVILSVNEATLTAHDPTHGTQLWSHPWPGGSTSNASASQPQVIPGDRILLTKGYGGGAELLKVVYSDSGEWQVTTVWASSRVLKTKFTNVAIVDECAYGLSDGILECVDLENGRSLWKRGRYEHGQLLAVDDLLLVLAESGELCLVEATPRSHRELGRIQALEGTSWNNLCLYGNLLLLRNGAEAACYELP